MNCIILVSLAIASVCALSSRKRARGQDFYQILCSSALVVAFFFHCAPTDAQTFYGSVSGIVKDSDGAVISEVAVTVHENNTATEYKTITNKAGAYRVSFLKPGSYTLRFEHGGFAQYVTNAQNLVLNQELVVDTVLKLGEATETINVSSSADVLNQTNSQIGGELST